MAVAAIAVPLFVSAAPVLDVVGQRVRVGTAGHRLGEFSVARDPNDPRHLVVGAMDLDHESGSIACVAYESRDAGATWASAGTIPGMQDGHAHLDPWVAIDPAGRVHLACLDNEIDVTAASPYVPTEYARRVGTTWSSNHTMAHVGGAARRNTDKLAMLADRRGHVYICVIESTPQGPVLIVHRSRDGGGSWDAPVRIGTDVMANCNGFVESPNGDITIAFINLAGPLGFATVGTVTSYDGGDTWQERTIIGQYHLRPGIVEYDLPQGRFGVFYPLGAQPNFPAIAVSPANGHLFFLYSTWEGERYTTKVWRSTDRGESFQPVSLLAPWSTTCSACSDLQATMTVDEAGNLGYQVVLADEMSLHREVWFTVSQDEGATWLAPIELASSEATESWLSLGHYVTGANQLNGLTGTTVEDAENDALGAAVPTIFMLQRRDGGDYWNITTVPGGFLAMWIDHTDTGIPQIWSRLVTLS
ncbi:MAG: hypothetical protein ACRDJM_03055 [Actinomycetota bacterium]